MSKQTTNWRTLKGMGRLANEAQKFLDRYRNENNCIPETNGELWLMQTYLPEARIVFDVQGYELEALKGAQKVLETCRHLIIELSFVEL